MINSKRLINLTKYTHLLQAAKWRIKSDGYGFELVRLIDGINDDRSYIYAYALETADPAFGLIRYSLYKDQFDFLKGNLK